MQTEIIIALIAFGGTALGTFGGIITSNKLTTYRIQQLEEKVKQHNSVVERTYKIEEQISAIKEDIHEIKKER